MVSARAQQNTQKWHQTSPAYTSVGKKEREYPEAWLIHEIHRTLCLSYIQAHALKHMFLHAFYLVRVIPWISALHMLCTVQWPVTALHTNKCWASTCVNSFSPVVHGVIASTRQQMRFHPQLTCVCLQQATVTVGVARGMWVLRGPLSVLPQSMLLFHVFTTK